MSKKILITGGAGFIGTHLSKKLTEMGHRVTVLDNLSKQVHGAKKEIDKWLAKYTNFIEGDVRNTKDWEKALDKSQIVIHLAAETGTGQSMYRIKNYNDVNCGGTAILLDIIANTKHSIEKVILASSRAVYGEGKYHCKFHGYVYPTERSEREMLKGNFELNCPECGGKIKVVPTDENSCMLPQSFYAITKFNQEIMIRNICNSLGVPFVIFRYQNVYGPGQSLKNPYTGILSIFSTRLKNDNCVLVFEDGKESRDFVYISDVVRATILGIENKKADGKIYNVGSGERISVLEVAKYLKSEFGSETDINITGQFRKGDIRHIVADNNKIKNELEFSPSYSFSRGIKEFVKWAEKQDLEKDELDKSIKDLEERGLIL